MQTAKCPRCKKLPEYSQPTSDVYELCCNHTFVQGESPAEVVARWNRSVVAQLARMRGRGLNGKYQKKEKNNEA